MSAVAVNAATSSARSVASWRPRLKRWLWRMSPVLFHAMSRRSNQQEFSIGIYRGSSLLSLGNEDRGANPVLTRHDVTDMPAAFVADPFMIHRGDLWHMFFEALDVTSFKGSIALATSRDTRRWQYHGVVISEPFHLAYPQVFDWQGQVYMVPDTPDQGVMLYRAIDFPERWERCEQLLSEPEYSDSSIFHAGDRLWMFSYWRRAERSGLRLFYASAPAGPWREHPASPVAADDDGICRPGGRPVVIDGVPIRFAQDCSSEYGKLVRAFRITRLDADHYEEQEMRSGPLLESGPERWHERGMHHVDAHRLENGRWVACVDGW